jgi:predicted amidohydrolase
MNELRIALAQCRQTAAMENNIEIILSYIEKASEEAVKIICFPEAQLVGYRGSIIPSSTPVFPDKIDQAHRIIADFCGQKGIGCILGTEIPLQTDPFHGKPYNSAIVISPTGNIIGFHHKTKLTPEDQKNYSPGQSFEVFNLFGVKFGIVICFEGFRFARTTSELVRLGAQLVFHPQNNTDRPLEWKVPVHHSMIVTRAAENSIWFASCNICQPKYQNSSSMIVKPDGRIFSQTELKIETLLIADIDIDLASRSMFNFDNQGMTSILIGD